MFKMSEQDQLTYYNEAMRLGLGSRLGQPFFTTVGKMRVSHVSCRTTVLISFIIKVKVPKYNNPRDLYSDGVMDEMISGTTSIE